jgi:hypothetical protein
VLDVDAWGATAAERAAPLPCDALVPDGRVLVRAVAVDAPAEVVFRWLCQLRAAPYSYDALDNLGRRSPQQLTPGLDDLRVGQRFMTVFRLAEFAHGERLTLLTPKTPFGRVAVTYAVTPVGERASRLLLRIAWRTPGPRVLGAALAAGDLVMARRQLLNLKQLAERDGCIARGAPVRSSLP